MVSFMTNCTLYRFALTFWIFEYMLDQQQNLSKYDLMWSRADGRNIRKYWNIKSVNIWRSNDVFWSHLEIICHMCILTTSITVTQSMWSSFKHDTRNYITYNLLQQTTHNENNATLNVFCLNVNKTGEYGSQNCLILQMRCNVYI